MPDPFGSSSDSVIAPARHAFPIAPDNINDLPRFTKALYIGTGGTIVLRAVGSDADVTFTNVQDGSFLDVRCRAIRAAGTTAAGIVGLA
ncbi:spike base protein, RCAP_Rcc01079 family [Qipengyuania sp. ASV99]|uniref:spike base protein, RCAP_Rcc01079 family n=1 Tax=Qipengyuania sp. ASV99 TaxID=3399681 RepID=UPI003A4C5F59